MGVSGENSIQVFSSLVGQLDHNPACVGVRPHSLESLLDVRTVAENGGGNCHGGLGVSHVKTSHSLLSPTLPVQAAAILNPASVRPKMY